MAQIPERSDVLAAVWAPGGAACGAEVEECAAFGSSDVCASKRAEPRNKVAGIAKLRIVSTRRFHILLLLKRPKRDLTRFQRWGSGVPLTSNFRRKVAVPPIPIG